MSAKRPLSAGSGVNALPDWEYWEYCGWLVMQSAPHQYSVPFRTYPYLSVQAAPPADSVPQRVSRPLSPRKPLRFLSANKPLSAGSGVNALPEWEYCGWLVMQSAPHQYSVPFRTYPYLSVQAAHPADSVLQRVSLPLSARKLLSQTVDKAQKMQNVFTFCLACGLSPFFIK